MRNRIDFFVRGFRGGALRRGGGGRPDGAEARGRLPPSMPLREAVLDACFEDCGEGEQGYAVLGAEPLDYGEERVDDVQSRCD